MNAFETWAAKPSVQIVLGMMRLVGPTEKDLRDLAEIAFEAGVAEGMMRANEQVSAVLEKTR